MMRYTVEWAETDSTIGPGRGFRTHPTDPRTTAQLVRAITTADNLTLMRVTEEHAETSDTRDITTGWRAALGTRP